MALDDTVEVMMDMLIEQGVMPKKPIKQPSEPLPPEPLRAPSRQAEPYPVDMLGPVMGGAAKALHETLKAPLALCCQSVLAAASFAVQSHFDVMLPWGEKKPTSLFFLSVAESGERKTALDDLVLGAAKAQERSELAGYEVELQQYEQALAKWKAANESALKKDSKAKTQGGHDDAQNALHEAGDKPKPPIKPLKFVSDPTVEGLYILLKTSQPSVAMFSDEGGLLLGGHAMNTDNALKTISRFCKLWDGAAIDRVRAVDGSGVLYGRRLALHQQAQPEVMTKLLSDPMANGQGFLARCLVAWPQSTIGDRAIQSFDNSRDRRELKRLFAKLKGFEEALPRTNQFNEQELDPVDIPLAHDAIPLAIEANNQFEALMKDGADLCELRDRTSKAF